MTEAERRRVLDVISKIQAQEPGPASNLKDFLVMPDYSRLRDPDRFLILGGRGTGKTRVFQALTTEHGFSKMIGDQRQLIGPNADNTYILVGYNIGSAFPTSDILDLLTDEKKARAFWTGSLLICLINANVPNFHFYEIAQAYLGKDAVEQFSSIERLKTPTKWISYIQQNPEKWGLVLDKINESLEQQDHWILVSYDALDTLTSQYSDLFSFLRPLLSFWHTQSKRWLRLRCKIFLRDDLYKSELLAFPDASKLNNCKIDLKWNTVSLYRLLIKQMANSGSPEAVAYLRQIPELISHEPESDLGYIPTEQKNRIEAFVSMLIGTYMGTSPKKGKSYFWFPNHLQDANGVLSPRPFLKCFRTAAEDMILSTDEIAKLQGTQLLLPSRIQGALVQVSNERVQELQEEFPWLEELKSAFSGLTMLMNQQDFIDHIDMDLWTDKQKKTLPADSPRGIFSVLNNLGIVFVANDGRVNVPEIYLHGFHMKRKGGLRRPERE